MGVYLQDATFYLISTPQNDDELERIYQSASVE